MESTRTQSVPMDAHALANLEGKSVLVTGAGGSIGSELCTMIAGRVSKLILVSISESALYKVQNLLKDAPCEVVGVLCDYGDQTLMTPLLKDTNIVIHAGAHKHVPICEDNPVTAILNNVWGTQKLINTAVRSGVQQFIQVSTDKAVQPESIMGATKRACELLCLRRDYSPMVVSVVRFGNVLNSDGSVIPLWKKQAAAGGPITITDKRCTRYFMSIPEACQLILAVIYMQKQGLFVLDMGEPVKMIDIAEKIIQQHLPDGVHIEIEEIGLRPGEKIEEELFHGGVLEETPHPRVRKVVEEGRPQPSHQYIPDMVEYAKKNQADDAIKFLWRIVDKAVAE